MLQVCGRSYQHGRDAALSECTKEYSPSPHPRHPQGSSWENWSHRRLPGVSNCCTRSKINQQTLMGGWGAKLYETGYTCSYTWSWKNWWMIGVAPIHASQVNPYFFHVATCVHVSCCLYSHSRRHYSIMSARCLFLILLSVQVHWGSLLCCYLCYESCRFHEWDTFSLMCLVCSIHVTGGRPWTCVLSRSRCYRDQVVQPRTDCSSNSVSVSCQGSYMHKCVLQAKYKVAHVSLLVL